MSLLKAIKRCFCVLTIVVSLFGCFSCGETQAESQSPSHACEFGMNIVYKEVDNKLYIGYPCKECEKVNTIADVIEVDCVIETSNRNPDTLLADVKQGGVVVYKKGNHSSNVSKPVEGVTVYGETGTVLYGWNVSNLTDVTVNNVKFEGGVTLRSGIKGLTYENCTFSCGVVSQGLVEKLTFDACTFRDITTDKETAIRVAQYKDLTVKNCVFDNVAYNALQVGQTSAQGEVLVQGNIFKAMKSRVLYFVDIAGLISCVIENNTFYNHHDNYVENENYDMHGCKKENGVYIYTKSTTGTLTIGVNVWENIPLDDYKYIAPIASYDVAQQRSIFDEE